jgi:ribulose-phosphate 3-epimerase
MKPIVVAPSILATDLRRLGKEVRAVDQSCVDWIHTDIMDGRFVANISCADHLLVQAESSSTLHLRRVLSHIRELGKKAGAVLDPGSPVAFIEQVLHLCDVVLVMTVNPGFGGQKFLPDVLPKIRELRELCKSNGLVPWIEVAGGQNGEMP